MKPPVARLRRIGLDLVFWCASLLVSLGAAAGPPSTWHQYRGDAEGYILAHLPVPKAILVYSRAGQLVSVIPYEYKDVRRVTDILATLKFPQVASAKLKSTSDAFGRYLLDQGYGLGNLVSKRTQYTLVYTTFYYAKPPACDNYAAKEATYEQAIRAGILATADPHAFSVVELALASPLLRERCQVVPHPPKSSTHAVRSAVGSQ